MLSRIGLWGGSCAIRLPKSAVEKLGLQEGEDVTVEIEAGALVIRPSRTQYRLEDLVSEAKALNAPPAFDIAPLGEEIL